MNSESNLYESSGDKSSDKEFNAWADKLEKMSDMEVSREVFNRIMFKSDIDDKSKELLSLSYEYCVKLINQNKPLEPNLLKIYLQDIKGYDINQVNLTGLILLLGCCGINFNK